MSIQQPVQVAKHIREFVYVDDAGNSKQICSQEIPSAQPMPNVGDQISFPDGLEKDLGIKCKVFKIIQRRFPLVLNGPSLSVVVFFVSDKLE